jgi:hypothetical protein
MEPLRLWPGHALASGTHLDIPLLWACGRETLPVWHGLGGIGSLDARRPGRFENQRPSLRRNDFRPHWGHPRV